ncbi:MAG: matrixin family metalloprotease [Solirubrobacterales bacterium]
MKRLLGAMVIAIFLALSIAAHAAPFPPRLNFAYDLAVQFWGREPMACSTIDKQVVPHGSLDHLGNAAVAAGVATQVPTQAPPGSVGCILWIDRTYAQPIVFDGLCAVMVHEVGHLLGMQHSSNPADVMNEQTPIPELCSAKGAESIRLYYLRKRLHRLRVLRGAKVKEMRALTQRELSDEAGRFWSLTG